MSSPSPVLPVSVVLVPFVDAVLPTASATRLRDRGWELILTHLARTRGGALTFEVSRL